MSISIVDYISDYLYAEILPASPIILIICEEHCLVPDSLKATSLSTLDTILILKGGLFVYRAGTSFDKGSQIGLALSTFPESKLFTPRRELFHGIIPNSTLEFLYQPAPSPKVLSSPGQNKGSSSSFEEIYNESLSKFTKTFLLDRALRAVKSRSLRAQAKNLIEGVLISLSRKYGKSEMVDSETIVDAMFDDFEKQGVLKVAYNSVEYNDALIEAFFGYHKTRIFVPGYEAKRNGGVDTQPVILSNNGVFDRGTGAFNSSRVGQEFQGDNGRPQFFIENFQNAGNPGFYNLGLAQNRPEPSTFMNTPKPPEPSNSSQAIFFQPFNNQSVNREVPLVRVPNRPYPATNLRVTPGNPSLNNGLTETSAIGLTENPVGQPNNSVNPWKFNAKNLFNWADHDSKIAHEVIEKVSSDNEIDSLIKLFKVCNRVARDYLNTLSLTPDNIEIEEKVKKNMKFAIETFFEHKNLDIDYLLDNMKTSANVKLVKALE